MEQQETFMLMITMFCHGILNMQETKYGVKPTKEILGDGMQHAIEKCVLFMQHSLLWYVFFIYAIMYTLLYKCRYTYHTLFLCL